MKAKSQNLERRHYILCCYVVVVAIALLSFLSIIRNIRFSSFSFRGQAAVADVDSNLLCNYIIDLTHGGCQRFYDLRTSQSKPSMGRALVNDPLLPSFQLTRIPQISYIEILPLRRLK